MDWRSDALMRLLAAFRYQFIKHAFGLMYCKHGEKSDEIVRVIIYLDDAPKRQAGARQREGV